MKQVIPLICLYLLQSGCTAPAEKQTPQKSPQTEITGQEHAGSHPMANAIAGKQASVADWVKRNLDIALNDSVFEAAGLKDTTLFTVDLSKSQREELFDIFFLGDKPLKEVTALPGVIRINLSDSDNKHLFITGNYVIVSCHLMVGNNGRSLIYDLGTRKLETIPMTVSDVLGKHKLEVWFDYYEESGHVWETGNYDILTKKFRRTSIER